MSVVSKAVRRKVFENWKLVLGLTGGIGSGKSTVLAMFKDKGAFTLDADRIVHDLLEKNRLVRHAIKQRFGTSVFDAAGVLNKRELASVVFDSKAKRRTLEAILHPRVRAAMWNALVERRGNVAVLDIPLLYESKWQADLDGVIVVDASLKKRVARLVKKGFSVSEAAKRIRAQMNLDEKVRLADFVIDNNGTIINTKTQVNTIWNSLHGGS